MLSFLKAAPVAALSLTLLSAASYSDAGFAFGASDTDSRLAADTVTINTDILAADAAEREAALKAAAVEPVIDAPVSQDKPDTAPISAASLAELVKAHGAAGELDAEMRCLAGAVYFESKGESLAGQLAVARVVLARTKSGRFPSTICGVVYQPSQFSFVRGGRMPAISTGSLHWKNAVAISKIALDGSWKSPVEGALFFHARYVSPGWKLKRVGTIDNHIFYR
jgi:N-acetylmuramoyl-L-alanine amidase